MKFGKVYEKLQQNPIFLKYLPDGQFLPYKHLKSKIKIMMQMDDPDQRSKENDAILNEIQVFINLICDYVDSHIAKMLNVEEHFIKHVKEYKALKEYSKINKEATRKIAKKYDKITIEKPQKPFLQKELLEQLNKRELGKQEHIDILLQKAHHEEQELLENENFGLLLQDVHQLHNNQAQILKMLDKQNDVKQTYYTELFMGFCLIVCVPVAFSAQIDTGISVFANIFVLTTPLAYFLGTTIGGSYGNKTLSRWQAFYLGLLFEAQVFGALTMGGFAQQQKQFDQVQLGNIHDYKAYTEDLNFVTLTLPAVSGFLTFNLLSSGVYSTPISVSKNCIIALSIFGLKQFQSPGFFSDQFKNSASYLLSPPLFALLLGMLIYGLIVIIVKKSKNPYYRAQQFLPFFGFLKVFIILYVGLHMGLKIQNEMLVIFTSGCLGLCMGTYLYMHCQSQLSKFTHDQVEVQKKVELQEMAIQLFKPLQLVSSLVAAFVNGQEDVGKFIKPVIQSFNVKNPSNDEYQNFIFWTLVIVFSSISCGILGLFSRTVKTKMTTMNPMEFFAIQVGASSSVILSTFLGYTLTPSYCTVASVMGSVLIEYGINYQKHKKQKHMKKLIQKTIFFLPFLILLFLYQYYQDMVKARNIDEEQCKLKNDL